MPAPALDAAHTAHRPWPVPDRPWALRMRWLDLLFLHWPVEPGALRPHVPAGLALDTFDGRAWLGVVPFRMSGVRPRLCPAVPGLSAFPELNLRTYVTAEGKPGVWFFSLDVPKRLPVLLARTLFHLPYFHARMECRAEAGAVAYASERRGTDAGYVGRYRATGDAAHSAPGSLEAFLTERYCLYSADRAGRLFRGEVHHAPWSLQPAESEIERCTLADGLGVELDPAAPLAHFSRELDVVAWALAPVE